VSCPDYASERGAYLDAELGPAAREAFESHLPGCSECRAALEAESWLAAQFGALPAVEPSPQFEARFWARVARDQEAAPSAWWQRLSSLRLATAGGSLAVVVAILLFSEPRRPDSDEWAMIASEDTFELMLDEDHELLFDLEVLEAWDGSREG
jgi:anti-sigma factor RsiW